MPDLLTRAEERIKAIRPDASEEDILEAWEAMEAAYDRVRDRRQELTDRIIEWMVANDVTEVYRIAQPGILTPDIDYRLRLKTQRRVKPKLSAGDAIEAVLTATGYDMEKAGQVISSNPLKQGAVKSVLGEDFWEELFFVEETAALDVGDPTKANLKESVTLAREDPRFVSDYGRDKFREAAQAAGKEN